MDKELDPLHEPTDDQQPELFDPLTGEIVDTGDPDCMIDFHERTKELLGQLSIFKAQLAHRLAGLVPGEKQTERFRTSRQRIRVEHPSDSWCSSKLREALNAYPELGSRYLRIERVAPQLREVSKLAHETGDPSFMLFKGMVLGANEGPRGVPRIVLEESEQPQAVPTAADAEEFQLPF